MPHAMKCRGCGYDLVGLKTQDPCPECAKPIVHTVRAAFDSEAVDFADLSRYLRLVLHAATFTFFGYPIAFTCTLLAMRGTYPELLFSVGAVAGLGLFLSWLVWFGSWAVLCSRFGTRDTGETRAGAAQSLSMFLFFAVLVSVAVVPLVVAFAADGAYLCACFAIPMIVIASIAHRLYICRRAMSLTDLLADRRLSAHLLTLVVVLNVLGVLAVGPALFLMLARGEPLWMDFVAALWYPNLACAFWVVVLTRLRDAAETMIDGGRK
ncbi:MAG: hypothetical protein KF705_14795 [Phycisphaeraceae bacterium]|nr:hypothetical protein [Phycisphaeraceae bacterium]